MEQLIPAIALTAGLLIGAVLVWFILHARTEAAEKTKKEAEAQVATFSERLRAQDQQHAESKQSLALALNDAKNLREQLRTETARLTDELRTESAAKAREMEKAIAADRRATESEKSFQEAGASIQTLQREVSRLQTTNAELETRLKVELRSADENIRLLASARVEMKNEFQNLATVILDEKSQSFTELNKTKLEALLNPLGERIRDFQSKVETNLVEETKQRATLSSQIENLQNLNAQIAVDAINLTNALKGQSKTQGTWGEVILERVLELSGLRKGTEYGLQVNLTALDGKRSQPDAIVYLPDERHIVIDAKVNLKAYERYCSMLDGPDREAELKLHITALRKHVSELSIKRYQDLYQLNSLDFVLMFVPIEPAFNLAIGTDNSVYDDAFGRRVIIVTPTTLHATLHTVSNIWRLENQNRNSQEIVRLVGELHDKFVGFLENLTDVGKRIDDAHKSYEAAFKQLSSGKGNLVRRVDKIRELGVKTKKTISKGLIELAVDDTDVIDDLVIDNDVTAEIAESEIIERQDSDET